MPEEPTDEENPIPAPKIEGLTVPGQDSSVIENPWQSLRQYTPARIALGRTGHSLPTRELLNFQLAHAQARDAVYSEFDPDWVAAQLAGRGYSTLLVHSQAAGRTAFLKQPDFGRRLSPESQDALKLYAAKTTRRPTSFLSWATVFRLMPFTATLSRSST